MIHEAIILSGGLGTRLRAVVRDLPKTMADINGKPFLACLLDYLGGQGFEKVILSVGYKREAVQGYFGNSYKNIKIVYSAEEEPLGTGGAVKKAMELADGPDTAVMNGDSFFKIDISSLYEFHSLKKAALTMAVRRMGANQRYGSLALDKDGRITGFMEKAGEGGGLINGGVYVLNKPRFLELGLPEKFSFEKDFLERYFSALSFYGLESGGYFIDIGVPEDYEKAIREL